MTLGLAFGANPGFGQNLDSLGQTLVLKEIQISATRLSAFSAGNKVLNLDSALIIESSDQNLGDILSRYTPVYLKSYGLGGLATTSFRGSGASHTPVVWNGFNLQSPLNGQVDFSLIPAFLLDQVQLQFGGAGALFGSGAIGGVVHLNQRAGIKSGLAIGANLGVGSFGSQFQGLQFAHGKQDQWSSSVKTFHHSADNDFPYEAITQPGSPTVRQANAVLDQFGVLNDNRFRLGAKSVLDLGIWYQATNRQIPPTMTQASSRAVQEDESFRVSAQWKQGWQFGYLAIRSALLNEKNEFQDPSISLLSLNKSRAWLNELELDGRFSRNYSWNLGAHWANYWGDSDNLGGVVLQNRVATFGSFRASTGNELLSGIVSLRQEVFDGKAAPLVPTIGLEIVPSANWLFKASMTRNYRLPTFNDLYWSESFAHGNSGLDPESGWSQDLTLNYDTRLNGLDFSGSLAVYNSQVKNWILWSPDTLGIWSPNNILNVHSRGLELKFNFGWNWGKLRAEVRPQYNYVRSTNNEVKLGNESSLDKQLIYVPENNSRIYISLKYLKLKLRYDHSFTGKTYVASDNSQSLPSYDVGNLMLQSQLRFWTLDWSLSGEVKNLWNQSYQVIAYRPMPPRSYQLNLALLFKR